MKSLKVAQNESQVFLQNLDEVTECEYIVNSGSVLTVVVFSHGQTSVEGKTHVRLVGNNSEAFIYGVFVNAKNNAIKLHTLQHHEAEGTVSNLLVKSVLTEQSVFSYDGAIRVEKTGQKTDAYQRNENLLLSEEAFAQSKPSLEILADDVRCTHGATIGSVDAEQLFFLATRGISPSMGKYLIVEGFLESVLEKITDTSKADIVRKALWQNLSKQLQ